MLIVYIWPENGVCMCVLSLDFACKWSLSVGDTTNKHKETSQQDCGFYVDLFVFTFADLTLYNFANDLEANVFKEQHWYSVMAKTHV